MGETPKDGEEVFDENLQQQFVHELLVNEVSSLLLLLLLLFSFSLEGFVAVAVVLAVRKRRSCSEVDAPTSAADKSTQLFCSNLLLSKDFCFFGWRLREKNQLETPPGFLSLENIVSWLVGWLAVIQL